MSSKAVCADLNVALDCGPGEGWRPCAGHAGGPCVGDRHRAAHARVPSEIRVPTEVAAHTRRAAGTQSDPPHQGSSPACGPRPSYAACW